jgi:hypothetical protein
LNHAGNFTNSRTSVRFFSCFDEPLFRVGLDDNVVVDGLVDRNEPVGNSLFLLDPFSHVVPGTILEILDAIDQLLDRLYANNLGRLKSKLLRVVQRCFAILGLNDQRKRRKDNDWRLRS